MCGGPEAAQEEGAAHCKTGELCRAGPRECLQYPLIQETPILQRARSYDSKHILHE